MNYVVQHSAAGPFVKGQTVSEQQLKDAKVDLDWWKSVGAVKAEDEVIQAAKDGIAEGDGTPVAPVLGNPMQGSDPTPVDLGVNSTPGNLITTETATGENQVNDPATGKPKGK